jgi:hypothetical protein
MRNQKSGTASSGVLSTLFSAFPAQRAARSSSNLKRAIPAYQLPRHMHHNRAEIESADLCGCISCERIFQTKEIRMWVAAGATAVCPRCNAAAVVGSGAGFQLTPDLLHRAHLLLFDGLGLRTAKPRSKPADVSDLTPLSPSTPVSA